MPPGRHSSGGNRVHHRQQQQHFKQQQRHQKTITTSSSLSSINSSGASSNSSTPTNTMTRNIGPVAPPDTRAASKGGGGAPPHSVGGRRRGGGGGWPESYLADDENYPSFQAQLAGMGLQLRDIPADGNCLFRALGDQLEGHCRNHFRHRAEVVNYMRNHRTDFEPFVEDDVSFDHHVGNLQKLGTHAGNDAIVAFAKVNAVEIIIHQLNQKPFMISGPNITSSDTRQLHLAYHNGDHYSSVRRLGDNTESPAHIRLQETLDSNANSLKKSQDYKGVVSAKRGLEDIETEVAIAAGCEDQEQVQQSLLECDYDVDAAIAFLLQQMEMSGEGQQDDSTSLASQQTSTDSGVFNSLPPSASVSTTNSNSSSPTSSNSRHGGIMLRNSSTGSSGDGEGGGILNGHGGSVNGGKGLKVHFREDSFGGNSSGYGSMSSNKGGGARPKVMAVPQQQVKLSGKKLKEMKKLEKKRKQEEKRREKVLGITNNNNNNIYNQAYYIPHGADVRDVTVVPLHEGRMARI